MTPGDDSSPLRTQQNLGSYHSAFPFVPVKALKAPAVCQGPRTCRGHTGGCQHLSSRGLGPEAPTAAHHSVSTGVNVTPLRGKGKDAWSLMVMDSACRRQPLRELETPSHKPPLIIILFIIPFKANLHAKFRGIVPILFLASANIPGKSTPKTTLASLSPTMRGKDAEDKRSDREASPAF